MLQVGQRRFLSNEVDRWLSFLILMTFVSIGFCFVATPPTHHGCPHSRQSKSLHELHMVSLSSNIESPRQLVREGMQRFRQADVEGSIKLFDRAEKLDSQLRPFLWQRGISYYYADRFKEGSDQFRYDVRVNPLVRWWMERILWGDCDVYSWVLMELFVRLGCGRDCMGHCLFIETKSKGCSSCQHDVATERKDG